MLRITTADEAILIALLLVLLEPTVPATRASDAKNKWVTLSNGSRVELDENGNIVKGMGGGHVGENVKEAAKQEGTTSTDKLAIPAPTGALNRDNMWDSDASEAEVKGRVKAWKDAPADAIAAVSPKEIDAAKSVGLPTTYSGEQAKPLSVALGEVVDNPFVNDKSIKGIDESSLGYGPATEQQVTAKDLIVIQDALSPSTVQARLADKKFDGIKVGEVDGKLVVLDGNHRLAAALLDGQENVKVTNVGKVVATY